MKNEKLFQFLDRFDFCNLKEIAMTILSYWEEHNNWFTPSYEDVGEANEIAKDYAMNRGALFFYKVTH